MSRSFGRLCWRSLAPWPLIEFTQWSVQRIFVLQLVVFILAGFMFSWMPLAAGARAALRYGVSERTGRRLNNSSFVT